MNTKAPENNPVVAIATAPAWHTPQLSSKASFCLLVLAVAYGFGLLCSVGIISGWENCYSASRYHTVQSEALLRGDLALSHNPSDLQGDLIWSEGGLQQLWGLGIPVLQLPFQLYAKVAGFSIFPENVATALLFSIVAFIVLKSFLGKAISHGAAFGETLANAGCVAILLLFPAFIGLLKARFRIYEETVAYTYLYAVLEVVLLRDFLAFPSKPRWCVMMLVSGFGPWIRPTLLFYGVATWTVGSFAFFEYRKGPVFQSFVCSLVALKRLQPAPPSVSAGLSLSRPRLWATGTCLFATMLVALSFCNWIRFGSFFEFGYHLALHDASANGPSYMERFGSPFDRAGFLPATQELFGWLFLAHPAADPTQYFAANLFWGQTGIIRGRECYFRTYDWTCFLLIGLGVTLMGTLVWHLSQRRLLHWQKMPLQLGVWSLISLGGLFCIYLHNFFISSRYALDFGPCFAVLTAILWYCMVVNLHGFWRKAVCFLLLVSWLSLEIGSAKSTIEKSSSPNWREAHVSPSISTHDLRQVGCERVAVGRSELPFDGAGWDPRTGFVLPSVNLFVENARFLEVEILVKPDMDNRFDLKAVRAKIGLEELCQESVQANSNAFTIRFKAPKRAAYREGIQPVWIAFMPDTHLADLSTPFILQRVRWRDN